MNAMILGSAQPLEANASAILVAVLVLGIVLLIVLQRRQKPGSDAPKKVDGPERPKGLPSTKEVFAPLPDEAKVTEKGAAKGEEAPWELMDEEELAAAQRKKAEAEAREEKRKAAEQAKALARVEQPPGEAGERSKAQVEADERQKAEEKERKRIEQEAHAEAARQAEARDKALKEAAEAEKARKKAEAEAEAKAKAEAKRKAAEAKAEAKRKAAEAKAAGDKADKKAAGDKADKKAAGDKADKKAAGDKADKKAAGDKADKKAAGDKADKKAAGDKADKKAAGEGAEVAKVAGEAGGSAPHAGASEDEAPGRTLKDGLGRTRKEGFIAKLTSLFAGKQIGDELMDDVEEALFTADIGVKTADRLLEAVKEALSKKELKDPGKVWEVLRGEAQKILEGAVGKPVGKPAEGEPFVTMVLGVNGTGKTTSIGKLANKLVAEKRKVLLVAGDTFRAAAAEQLDHWARRVGAPCVKGKDGADPASVVFDGVKQGLDEKVEHVLVDTAGRLHNNVNLMEELKKVRRVMSRAVPTAPHEVLMVLDATTGQNGIQQAKQFKDATEVTGIILTKLDGTAKGGVVLGVCDELKIPIKWVGVGERVSDLRPFDPREFVDELFAPPA